MKVIAVSNQKGGVGKSTTVHILAAALTSRGKKVLCIDMDAQGNLTYFMGGGNHNAVTILDVLRGHAAASAAILKLPAGALIPSTPVLATADLILTETGKEYRLKEGLDPIKGRYDFILLDTPPSMGILAVNALTAADAVIIPVQADIVSLQGMGQLAQNIETVKKYCNPHLKIAGIFATRYNARTVFSQKMAEMLQAAAGQLNTKLFNTKIRECTALKESQGLQKDIFTYNPKSNAATDYNDLFNELKQGGIF